MIAKIVVHCSDSEFGDAATIHKWHLERGWSGIGYHYVVTQDGTVEQGRPHYWTGAHVRGHNKDSLGICLIGVKDFTNEQVKSLVRLRDELTNRYPEAEWFNHYDLDPSKTCPNFDAVALLFP